MANNELSRSEIDVNRHYLAILGGDDNRVRIRFACGSEEDVVISQIMGGFIRELEEDFVDLAKGGPLFIDCSKHGKFLGYWQLLQRGPATQTGEYPVSLPLLMIPLRDVEHVLSFGMR